MKLQPVYLEWVDPQSVDAWTDLAEVRVDRLPLIRSVGLVVSETRDMLVIAQNYDKKNDQVSMVMHIPLVNIKKLTKL